jgi:hypothetical protein
MYCQFRIDTSIGLVLCYKLVFHKNIGSFLGVNEFFTLKFLTSVVHDDVFCAYICISAQSGTVNDSLNTALRVFSDGQDLFVPTCAQFTNIAALLSLEPTVNLTSNSVVYHHHIFICISFSFVHTAVGVKFNIASPHDSHTKYVVQAIELNNNMFHISIVSLLIAFHISYTFVPCVELINQGVLLA